MKLRNLLMLTLLVLCGCNRNGHYQYQGYVEGENIYIASPYAGILVKKLINRGESVRKDQILFQLDENPEALVVKQREAQLLQAQKNLNDLEKPRRPEEIQAIKDQINQVEAQRNLAQLRVQRFGQLRDKGAIDKDTYDAAVSHLQEVEHQKEQYQANLALAQQGSRTSQIQAQQAAVENASASLRQSQWQLAQKTLTAAADGIIFDTYYLEGEYVPAQQPIASLLSASTLRIEFFVPVLVMNQLKIGQAVTFQCDGCNTSHQAVIRYISPQAEYIPPLVYSDNNVDKLVYRIKASVNPSEFSSLKPGQPVMVQFYVH